MEDRNKNLQPKFILKTLLTFLFFGITIKLSELIPTFDSLDSPVCVLGDHVILSRRDKL